MSSVTNVVLHSLEVPRKWDDRVELQSRVRTMRLLCTPWTKEDTIFKLREALAVKDISWDEYRIGGKTLVQLLVTYVVTVKCVAFRGLDELASFMDETKFKLVVKYIDGENYFAFEAQK